MNVVVGIVVNAISEVSENRAHEEKDVLEDTQTQLRKELASLRKQLAHVEELLAQQEVQKH